LVHVVQLHILQLIVSGNEILFYLKLIYLYLATGEGTSPTRRELNGSSTVYYQPGPTQTIESYRMYSQPSSTITQVTEETQVYQIPSRQQHNEITYSIHGAQQKFQPISFLVSSNQDTTQPTITTDEDDQSMTTQPYQQFHSQYRTRPNQSAIPSYEDDTSTTTTTTTTTRYSQQPRQTNLLATVAKQAGPTRSYYQQESDSMQTESESSPSRTIHSTQQQSSDSYILSRPNFTKVN
jgi:hypothetical protein